MQLESYLLSKVKDGFLPWHAQIKAATKFDLSYSQVEETALKLSIMPVRYKRNMETISPAQQLCLFQSKIAVLGCGGLGCYAVEELARLGVGQVVAVDFDFFEEHNLNRQLFATINSLGQSKAETAMSRAAEINPAVTVRPVRQAFSPENGELLLEGVQVVIDALDSIPLRLSLAEICSQLSIPMVHGAIGGWYGQVTTLFPGDNTLNLIYGNYSEDKGVEKVLGNPSFTPAIVASLQAAEACKLLLGQGECLRHRVLYINLLSMEFEEIELG